MAIFAKFVMRDNGLPIHISPQYVAQVRPTQEAEATAIFIAGRETPIVVEGKLDAVMKRLEAPDASDWPELRLVKPRRPTPEAAKPRRRIRRAPPTVG